MVHRLSPRESRRLVRQFLRQEERSPAGVLFAAGRAPSRRPSSAARPARSGGPYEVDDITADGYVIERTIIVP